MYSKTVLIPAMTLCANSSESKSGIFSSQGFTIHSAPSGIFGVDLFDFGARTKKDSHILRKKNLKKMNAIHISPEGFGFYL